MRKTFLAKTILFMPFLMTSGAQAQSVSVVVSSGDTLAELAQKHLNDADRWREICDLNRKVVGRNCNIIVPGMTLKLPEASMAAKRELDPEAGEPQMAEENTDAKPVEAATETMAGDNASASVSTEGEAMKPSEMAKPVMTQSINVGEEEGTVFFARGAFKATRVEGADTVTLSGMAKDPSPGGRPGLWVRVSDDFEKAASGKTIRVSVATVARQGGPISLSYSTADVGNSGWQQRELSAGENTVSFEYEVRPMKQGRGDYLGILPDPENTGQTIAVKSVTFDVLK